VFRAKLSHARIVITFGKPAMVCGMPTATNTITRIGSTIFGTLILMLPALWNRFPLLEYDTGGYLARWFEGYLVPSRSTTYGLFLAGGWPLDFWPIVLLQAR